MTPIFSQMILSQAETQVESAAETAAEILQETLPVAQEVAEDISNLKPNAILETLKNNGIPAYKKDLGYASVMNIYGGYSNGGEEIYVAEENQEKAAEILVGMGYDLKA